MSQRRELPAVVSAVILLRTVCAASLNIVPKCRLFVRCEWTERRVCGEHESE